MPLWAGLDSLILTLPMILWLTRAIAGVSAAAAVQQAIELVDDHFAGDQLLGLPHIQFLQRTLAQRRQVEKLVGGMSEREVIGLRRREGTGRLLGEDEFLGKVESWLGCGVGWVGVGPKTRGGNWV